MAVQIGQQMWKAAAQGQGVSLGYLAAATGLSMHTVYSYSIGRRRPTASWIAAVYMVLAELASRGQAVRQNDVQTVTYIIGSVLRGVADRVFRWTRRALSRAV